MFRYRFRIVLLSLGVLFGYGSAIHHLYHGGGGHRCGLGFRHTDQFDGPAPVSPREPVH